jgi:hypothetical protein
MSKKLLSLLPLLTAASLAGASTVSPFAGQETFNVGGLKAAHEWVKTSGKKQPAAKRTKSRIVTAPESKIGPASIYGTLNGPDGTTWLYTAAYTLDASGSYSAADLVIYDNNNKKIGEIHDEMTLGVTASGVKETSVNQIEINPLVTQKFFNSSDADYEVMLFIHATTEDYTGHYYNHVFSLNPTTGVTTQLESIEGNEVMAVNTSEYSENYTMVFQEENYNFNDDGTDESVINYLVYGKKTYSSDGPVLKHTFSFDIENIASMGEAGLPVLMQYHNYQLYFATAQYEQPYFDQSIPVWEDAVVNKDNSLVITVFNEDYEQQSVTKIPVPTEADELGDYIYKFPIIGGLNYTDDLTFGQFSEGDTPAFIITFDNYATSDEYIDSFYVYDVDGNRIKTIYEDASAALYLSDVAGQDDSFCFWHYGETDDDNYFAFVEFPSCEETATIPVTFNGAALSSSLDRVADRTGYKIAIAESSGTTQDDGSITTRIFWFDKNGKNVSIDEINLGDDVAYALPYISGKALTPYLFNTDDKQEYMFLVKTYLSDTGTATEEHLVIYNTDSERLLEFAPNEDGALSNIMLMNLDTNPTLLTTYVDDDYATTLTFTSLPLSKFEAGGTGTAADPYLISTAGDFMQIKNNTSANYRLVSDIDFNGGELYTISDFTGTLDGNNHIVSNLVVNGPSIFGEINGAVTVKDLVFNNATIANVEDGDDVGLIAGYAMGEGSAKAPSITNVKVYGLNINTESSGATIGGLVGVAALYANISDCYVENGDIADEYASIVGGIVGDIRTSTKIVNCAFNGAISGKMNVGGIVGKSSIGDETVSNCHANADITGSSRLGGIVGYSSRSLVENCVAEGSVAATAEKDPAAGGIIGYLEGTYSSAANIIVKNNIAALTEIIAPTTATVHRIVGYTSVDVVEIDWANEDFDWDNWDYKDYTNVPTLPGNPETNLANNYAFDFDVVDSSIEAADTTTEGATAESLTKEFLEGLGFVFGDNAEAPWVITEDDLELYFEDAFVGLIANDTTLTLAVDETATISFTVLGGDADDVVVESSNAEAIEITNIAVEDDVVTVTVHCNAIAEATITASYNGQTASCNVFGVSGIDNVIANAATLLISYNNGVIYADNADITVYAVNGALVANGRNNVSTAALAPGVYVARAISNGAAATAKIVVK